MDILCHGADFSLALLGGTRWPRYSWTRDRGSQLYFCLRSSQDLRSYTTEGVFFWAYSGIGIVGISQTIVRSRATLIPEWL